MNRNYQRCMECKGIFPKDTLTQYTPPRRSGHKKGNYCAMCYGTVRMKAGRRFDTKGPAGLFSRREHGRRRNEILKKRGWQS